MTTQDYSEYNVIQDIVSIFNKTFPQVPKVGIVLGSGLGSFANTTQQTISLGYSQIPSMPQSTVSGHAGNFVYGTVQDCSCFFMQGRLHSYEGHSTQEIVRPIRAMIAWGINTILITNAAGSLHTHWPPGTLVAIQDHINLQYQNPLTGANDDRLGQRFPDMSQAYCPSLRHIAETIAKGANFALPQGVYAAMSGPNYETPAEIRMLRILGADLVGMSTVPEVIAARHMGAKVLALSCVTNLAAGIGIGTLSHDEVKTAAAAAQPRFETLLTGIISAVATNIPAEQS